MAPAWWVIRGLIGAFVLSRIVLGMDIRHPVTIALAVLGVAVSVWLARRVRETGAPMWRGLSVVGSALAVSCGLVIAANLSSLSSYGSDPYQSYVPHELMYREETVTNLYVYGADGRRIDDVRIFDQRGNQLVVEGDFPGGVQDTFPYTRAGGDPWLPDAEMGQQWTPPMTLTPLAGGDQEDGSESSTESSSSTSEPSRSSSESSSSSTSRSSGSSSGSPSPRSTTGG